MHLAATTSKYCGQCGATRRVRKEYIEVCGKGHDWDDLARSELVGVGPGVGVEAGGTVDAGVGVPTIPLAVRIAAGAEPEATVRRPIEAGSIALLADRDAEKIPNWGGCDTERRRA